MELFRPKRAKGQNLTGVIYIRVLSHLKDFLLYNIVRKEDFFQALINPFMPFDLQNLSYLQKAIRVWVFNILKMSVVDLLPWKVSFDVCIGVGGGRDFKW